MAEGIDALLEEARRRGTPMEPFPGAAALADSLKKLRAGDDRPVRALLGLSKRNGRPAVEDQEKVALLAQERMLRAQGTSSEAAADAVGARWPGTFGESPPRYWTSTLLRSPTLRIDLPIPYGKVAGASPCRCRCVDPPGGSNRQVGGARNDGTYWVPKRVKVGRAHEDLFA
jgi:hypothetical protein